MPHPSKDPRRADQLIVEYQEPLFVSRKTPTSNILYALRIPLKTATDSNPNPASHSRGNKATVPVQTLPATAI